MEGRFFTFKRTVLFILSIIFICFFGVSCTLDEGQTLDSTSAHGKSNAPEKKPDIEDFVTFSEIVIPHELFDCEFNECTYEDIAFIRSHQSHQNADGFDFERGYVFDWYKDTSLFKRDTLLERSRDLDGVVCSTEEFRSVGAEKYSDFKQVTDKKGFTLTQLDFLGLPLSAAAFGTESQSMYIHILQPASFPLLNGKDVPIKSVKYEMSSQEELKIVRISGEYDDSQNRAELKNIYCDVTYVIKDNIIVAYIFNEKAFNDSRTEYTELTEYCIPYTDGLNLLPQKTVDELLAKVNKDGYLS